VAASPSGRCYAVLFLKKPFKAVIPAWVENGLSACCPEPSALEERVGVQALAIDLKQAVLACLTGAESRRWTVGERWSRLKGLGVPCSRASVTGALSELELELSLCPWAPWRLTERSPEWALVPKSELTGLLSGVRAIRINLSWNSVSTRVRFSGVKAFALEESWELIRKLFPADLEALARQSGSLCRARKVGDAETLLRPLLMHGGGLSLEQTVRRACQQGLGGL
jgi:hypothetical protein